MERTFTADVERVGDVAGQTHVQGTAEALVMWLRGWEGHDAVSVVELPTQRYHAALYTIIRLLTHKARVDTWNLKKTFLSPHILRELICPQPCARQTHQCCIHDRGTFPWEPLTGQCTADERLRNSGPHTPAGLLSFHTPAQTFKQRQNEERQTR